MMFRNEVGVELSILSSYMKVQVSSSNSKANRVIFELELEFDT